MRAKLKRVHSPDILDFSTYWPEDPANFGFLLQMRVGPDDQDGEEAFDLTVCTPKWLTQNYRLEDIVVGRHKLIVFEYDFHRLLRFLEAFCQRCTGSTWEEVAAQVSQLGRWEFESYVPD